MSRRRAPETRDDSSKADDLQAYAGPLIAHSPARNPLSKHTDQNPFAGEAEASTNAPVRDDQPLYPGSYYPSQFNPKQNSPNQTYPSQFYSNQYYPNQHYPNQHYPNQHYPNQFNSDQSYPQQTYDSLTYHQGSCGYHPNYGSYNESYYLTPSGTDPVQSNNAPGPPLYSGQNHYGSLQSQNNDFPNYRCSDWVCTVEKPNEPDFSSCFYPSEECDIHNIIDIMKSLGQPDQNTAIRIRAPLAVTLPSWWHRRDIFGGACTEEARVTDEEFDRQFHVCRYQKKSTSHISEIFYTSQKQAWFELKDWFRKGSKSPNIEIRITPRRAGDARNVEWWEPDDTRWFQ